MEQAKWRTPSEKRKCESPLPRSPWVRGTPVKQNDVQATWKRLTYQNNAQCMPLSVLSNYMTPPSKLRKFIANNPFEPDLINRLHLPAISPTVFAKVSSPMQQPSGFTWSIEELAHMKPAKIEESPMQQVHSPDSETEMRAQAAIDRFFNETHIPSPWDIRQQASNLNPAQDLSKSKKDAWSQTVLSLPLDLPQNVEEALKPFCTFTQEQNADRDDVNSSNSSLRRKLFLCHDEGTDNESLASLSPVKMVLPCSPPESGMIDGAPLKRLLQRRRSRGSSVVTSEESPNISPIHNAETDRLHKRLEHSYHTATRLNFTVNMSTDDIAEEKSLSSVNGYYSLDMSDNENHAKRTEDNGEMIIVNNDRMNACDSINMEELPNCVNSTDNIAHSNAIVFSDRGYSNEISLKIVPETASFSRERHKGSNIMSGAFEQQSIISNSVQDTGYHTYSMSSTMPTLDSYNASTSHKTLWNERIATSKENAQLSWRESIKFSSTPSKYNKESGS